MNRARRRLTSVIEPITMSERRIPYIYTIIALYNLLHVLTFHVFSNAFRVE